ncbi:LysE family translocator [Photobacterium rosenbergii]|uniref:LysE family translocator n=1 Tax=Photobacterium rosenbergii TaxID=294936 RepID=A0ABU3ZI02_9GAMM|nr:LysE family translocator [Photobacterium rosenbergii]MDV5169569.1 LysE family translocator [Photobacterium rosenbergii]
MLPGPDSVLIAGRAASQGFRAGSAAALGIGSGIFVHIVAASLGLSAILSTSATAFTVVKIIGGFYLLYMAFSMFKDSNSQAESTFNESASAVSKKSSLLSIYTQGLITNVFNPKVALFFLSFMPQFISSSSENKALAFMVLGLIFNFTGMIWCHFIAWVSATMSRKLSASQSVRKWFSRLAASLFGVFGVKLLVSTQS